MKRLLIVLGLCVLLLAACCANDANNDGIIGNDGNGTDMEQDRNDTTLGDNTNGNADMNDDSALSDMADGVGNAVENVADGVGDATKDIGKSANNVMNSMTR